MRNLQRYWVGSVGLLGLLLSQPARAQAEGTEGMGSVTAGAEPATPPSAPQVNEPGAAASTSESMRREASAPGPEAVMPPNYRSLPLTLRPEPGEAPPWGYIATEEVSTKGLIFGGSLLGGSYLIGLAAGVASDFHNQGGWLGIPLAGPWLSLTMRRNPCQNLPQTLGNSGCDVSGEHYLPRAMLFLDGVAQLTGAALLVWTLATPTRKFVRRDVAEVHLLPAQFGRDAFGLAAVGRF